MTCENPLPQGVTCTNLSTASPTVTFTGPSAKIVDLTVNALNDNIKETGESVQIGLGTLDSSSGTGLGGGATGMDNLADFDIVEAIVARLLPVADLTTVSEGKKDAAASLTVFVSSGAVRTGGVKIPFTVNSGTAQRRDASAADYGTVPDNVFIAAGATEGTALVPIVDDLDDEPSERLRFTIGKLPPGYAFDSGQYDANESLDTIIVDDDKTEVSLAGGGTITEQDTTSTVTMMVSLGRPLRMKLLEKDVAETLKVPLELTTTTGATLPGSVNPLFAVTASGTNVTLTDANTTTPTLTFTGHDDYENDVQTATVTFTATSNGDSDLTPEIVTVTIGKLTGLSAITTKNNSATLTVADNDVPAGRITVSKASTSVTEAPGAGNTDTYTVKLGSQPTGNVSIRVVSGTPAAARVHGPGGAAGTSATLTFTPVNWNTAQTVTVTGVDDTVDQSGNRSVTISHSATSEDGNYNDVSIPTVTATVVDNDTADLIISSTSLGLSEGDSASYTVRLATQPTDTVTVTIGKDVDATANMVFSSTLLGTLAHQHLHTQAIQDLTLSKTSLVFTPATWNNAQTVTVTAGEDGNTEVETATLMHDASGSGYNNVEKNLPVTVTDNDTPGLVLTPTSLGLSEGGSSSFTVKLATQPTDTVTVAITGHSGTDLTLDTTRLTFTPATWSDAQMVTVTAREDNDTANDTATLVHTASGGDYALSANVAVTVTDNDTPGLVLTPTSLGLSEGGSASFTVKLATQPTDTVTVAITGHSGTDLTLDTTSLTFTPATWNDAQMVTVTVGEDSDAANDTATLVHTASGGDYALSANVAVTVTDNDTPGLVLTPTSLGLSEGGSASFTVKLATQPTDTVTVAITGHSGTDLTLDTTRLTFTPATWSDARTVTVTSREDSDTANELETLRATASGGYDLTANVVVAVTDNDTPGLVLTPTSLEMTEGGSAGFTVKLATEPTDTVTVAITGHSETDLTLDTTRLTFTPATWNNARTVTVTAREDSDTANELETLRATASGGGYDLTANVTVTVTDNDDDLPPSSTPPSSTPVVAIMGGSAITEGEDASFTLTANPAPAPGTNINVAVTISDSGSFARTGQIGSRVVRINDRGTASFTVSTENDSVDEEDGRITVVVQGGTDHRPHGSNAVASVTVGDDDAPAVMAPNGWHLRFGRTISQQVLDALQGRFAARPTAGLALTVAGEAITSAPPLEEHEGVLAKALGFETITTEALVQGSSFSFTPSAEGAAPQPAFWGQGALASFTGQEAALSLDGDVTTALLGADWSTERWRAGAALSHSWGSGSYEAEKDADQEISSTLTGLFPYGRYGLTPRLGIWAVAGYGWGQLSLEPDGTDGEYQPGANLTMAAVGLDGLLIDGGAEGLNLTTTTDLLTLSTTSEEVDGVQSSEGSVTRLRLGLVATRPVPLAHGASLLPSLEIGVRQDSGDAETGFGLELGAGLTWEDPQHGISAQVRGRTLLTHADEDFREQGMALSFFWQPHPSHRGPSFSLSHAVGATAAGGMDALLRPTVIEGLDGPGNGQRLEAEAAYGFPAFADRLTLTPALALALSPDSSTYGLLWSVAPYSEQDQAGPWEVSLEGQRHEHVSSPSPTDHSLNLRFSLLF